MFKFSQRSKRQLATCHPDLQTVMHTIIQYRDIVVLEGYRPEQRQNALHAAGKTYKQYPNSKHNQRPSMAVDIAPFPIDWHDTEAFVSMGYYVLGIADAMYDDNMITHRFRWLGDGNRNWHWRDQKFLDMVHFELIS